jgi:hypothetical protein
VLPVIVAPAVELETLMPAMVMALLLPPPMTVRECLNHAEELTTEQASMLRFVVEGSSNGNTLHPRITDLASLRRWLQDGVEENAALDEAQARADQHRHRTAGGSSWSHAIAHGWTSGTT